ncbi:MAG: DUF4198 domain-containing protein [Luteimonas sp.]
MITFTRNVAAFLLMGVVANASAHDLFVSFAQVPAGNGHAPIAVINNGTFDESVGAVTRARLRDVSLRSAGKKSTPSLAEWKVVGKQSQLSVQPAGKGTYLLGVSTKASTSTRTAAEFSNYLELEDLPDTLATYDPSKYPNGVTYSYTKHARAIGQGGGTLTEDYAASSGYPLEIRLLRNPGSVNVGEALTFQVLHDGEPVPNLRVYVGHRAEVPVKGGHGSASLMRTDANGQGTFDVTTARTWYIFTNYMVPSTQKGLEFVSDRASLTFEILANNGHSHVH